jgi:FKBP-type peptidyl-prolyl cis-trans isomerase
MKFRLLFPLFIITILFLGCEKSLEDDKRESNEREIIQFLSKNKLPYIKENGVYHAVSNEGYGYEVNKGDSISFWYVGYTLQGIVFDTNVRKTAEKNGLDTSIRNFNPISTIAGSSKQIEGLRRGLLLCRQGELGTILFPSTLGFGEDFFGPIDPWTPLAYDILIINVKNQQIEQEQNIISNFVASSLGFFPDTIGFFYNYLTEIESDIQPSLNDTIYGWYKGSILNGNAFVELPSEGEMIVLNKGHLIDGLLFGLLRMNPGEEMQVVFPSSLGYGNFGFNNILPYTPLMYQLRLDSIKQ